MGELSSFIAPLWFATPSYIFLAYLILYLTKKCRLEGSVQIREDRQEEQDKDKEWMDLDCRNSKIYLYKITHALRDL